MKILAIEHDTPGTTVEMLTALLDDEAMRAWELYQDGLIREIYFRGDQSTAVLVLECEDRAEAEAALASLPLVKAGLIAFDIMPLVPYPGFARLFASDV